MKLIFSYFEVKKSCSFFEQPCSYIHLVDLNKSCSYFKICICYALCNLVPFVQFKKPENTHGGVLLLVKLQASACNFTKSNTPPKVFVTVFNPIQDGLFRGCSRMTGGQKGPPP